MIWGYPHLWKHPYGWKCVLKIIRWQHQANDQILSQVSRSYVTSLRLNTPCRMPCLQGDLQSRQGTLMICRFSVPSSPIPPAVESDDWPCSNCSYWPISAILHCYPCYVLLCIASSCMLPCPIDYYRCSCHSCLPWNLEEVMRRSSG